MANSGSTLVVDCLKHEPSSGSLARRATIPTKRLHCVAIHCLLGSFCSSTLIRVQRPRRSEGGGLRASNIIAQSGDLHAHRESRRRCGFYFYRTLVPLDMLDMGNGWCSWVVEVVWAGRIGVAFRQ